MNPSSEKAFETARAALHRAFEASQVVEYLRRSRARHASALSRARALTEAEIAGLNARGNCSDWSGAKVLGDEGDLESVVGCHFEGSILFCLEKGSPTLFFSRFRDVVVGAATVEDCRMIGRARIEDGAFLRNVGELRGLPGSRFGLGSFLQPGSETGARKIFLVDGLTVDDCAAMAALHAPDQDALARELESWLEGLEADHLFVGGDSRLEHVPVIENAFLGPGSTLRAAAWVRNAVFASTLEAPVVAGEAALVADSILDAGSAVHHGAQVHHSLLLEFSGAERGAQVSDSVLGPSTVAAKGEITASLVGPFVGFHHQSLLIGALWPQGRGNIAYGANVGSNHTGRKPDQELRPGEGVFFGLGCSVKFPANYEASPYSLLASGVTAPPQRVAFPFSLILSANAPEADGAAGLNEIMPGWMWSENGYALARNAYKYADRNRARRHAVPAIAPPEGSPLAGSFLGSDLFAPAVSKHVLKAFEVLAQAEEGEAREVYLAKDVEGLGANFLRGKRLAKARAAYANYLVFLQCRIALWSPVENPMACMAAKNALLALGVSDLEGLFSEFLASVEESLAKDTARGRAVFDDYEAFHGAPADDAVCKRLRADLEGLLPGLRERLR